MCRPFRPRREPFRVLGRSCEKVVAWVAPYRKEDDREEDGRKEDDGEVEVAVRLVANGATWLSTCRSRRPANGRRRF